MMFSSINNPQKSQPQIRPFEAADYPEIIELYNQSYPDSKLTLSELVQADNTRDPKCLFSRFIAVLNNQVVGFCQYCQQTWCYHPHHFFLTGFVHTRFRKRGLGTALSDRMLGSLKQFDPQLLITHTCENRPESISFLLNRGFREKRREANSSLSLSSFDPEQEFQISRRLTDQQIAILSFRDLEHDPQRDHKINELYEEINLDLPGHEHHTQRDFETFCAEEIYADYRLPEGNFVAVQDQKYLGLCCLMINNEDNSAFLDFTGVRKDFRHQGIALELKLTALKFGKNQGFSAIKTSSNMSNEAILSLNRRLGFISTPTWIIYHKLV